MNDMDLDAWIVRFICRYERMCTSRTETGMYVR